MTDTGYAYTVTVVQPGTLDCQPRTHLEACDALESALEGLAQAMADHRDTPGIIHVTIQIAERVEPTDHDHPMFKAMSAARTGESADGPDGIPEPIRGILAAIGAHLDGGDGE